MYNSSTIEASRQQYFLAQKQPGSFQLTIFPAADGRRWFVTSSWIRWLLTVITSRRRRSYMIQKIYRQDSIHVPQFPKMQSGFNTCAFNSSLICKQDSIRMVLDYRLDLIRRALDWKLNSICSRDCSRPSPIKSFLLTLCICKQYVFSMRSSHWPYRMV